MRPYHAGDERALVALHRCVFGEELAPASWLWKLKGRPAPVENVWIAEQAGRPVFQYGAIPVRCRLPGGERDAMVSVDVMCAPEHRGQGLLTRVAREVYERWRAGGIAFTIGLPNAAWGSRTRALGWRELFPLRWMVRTLRPERILARRLRAPFLERAAPLARAWHRRGERRLAHDRDVAIREVEKSGAELDTLWERCAADGLASIVRDRAWVHWRYLEPPNGPYRVLVAERNGSAAGYLAFRRAPSEPRLGHLADLLAPAGDGGAQAELLGAALQRLRAAGAETAAAQAVPGTAWTEALERAGFRPRWSERTIQMAPLDPELRIEDLRDARRWRIAGGDFDLI